MSAASNRRGPFKAARGAKRRHEADPPSSRAFDRKPADQPSSTAQDPSTKPAQQKRSNRADRDEASQRAPAPENPPDSPPQENSSKQPNPNPPSLSQQEDAATDSQGLPRVWNDYRRNTLEKLQSLSLELQATARHVSACFRILFSLFAPFVEKASDIFCDAIALVLWICKVSTSAFDMLVPKILVHVCMVLFVTIGIILLVLSLLAGILKDKYCNAITAMPSSMIPSSATAICLPPSQSNFASSSLLPDTLQGFQPRIPDVWQYLDNIVDSVNRDLVEARRPDLLLSMEAFRPKYLEGLQEAEVLERQFMRQQRALWTNVNHFIRNIRPDRPEPHWIFELLGFVNTALVREVKDSHQELIEILDNSREQTMAFQRRLSQDHPDPFSLFGKLFGLKTDRLRENLSLITRAKAALDPGQDDPDNILESSTLWGASEDVVLDMLFHRREMLIGDITWLSEKLAELKGNLAILKGRRNVTKEVWGKQVEELMEKAWAIASEWRGKLKEYFVVYD